jgi:hypothetical protein
VRELLLLLLFQPQPQPIRAQLLLVCYELVPMIELGGLMAVSYDHM